MPAVEETAAQEEQRSVLRLVSSLHAALLVKPEPFIGLDDPKHSSFSSALSAIFSGRCFPLLSQSWSHLCRSGRGIGPGPDEGVWTGDQVEGERPALVCVAASERSVASIEESASWRPRRPWLPAREDISVERRGRFGRNG
jgi:hypothetical protein